MTSDAVRLWARSPVVEPLLFVRAEGSYVGALCLWHPLADAPLDEVYNVLHPQEARRFQTLQYAKQRRDYLLGRYAVKNAVSCVAGVDDLSRICIQTGVFQQPLCYHLTPHERSIANGLSCSLSEALTKFWTAKESLSKVLRTGLTVPLQVLEIAAAQEQKAVLRFEFRKFFQYLAQTVRFDRYCLALSLPSRTRLRLRPTAAQSIKAMFLA